MPDSQNGFNSPLVSLVKLPWTLTLSLGLNVWRALWRNPPPPLVTGLQLDGPHPPLPLRGSTFSDIFKALLHGQHICMKRLRIFEDEETREDIQKSIIKDAIKWQRVKHPSILPFIGVDATTFTPMIALITPWREYGNVQQYLSKFASPDIDLDALIYEAAQGLEYLHSVDIIHGDLRGANILIDDDGRAQLADFGLAGYADLGTARMTAPGGAPGAGRWMAPELHYPTKFGKSAFMRTEATDVFAFAMCCLEIYTNAAPFAYIANDASVYLMVVDGKRPRKPSSADCAGRICPQALWDVVQLCWASVPDDRPNMMQVVRRLPT